VSSATVSMRDCRGITTSNSSTPSRWSVLVWSVLVMVPSNASLLEKPFPIERLSRNAVQQVTVNLRTG
jgi:hypothetical protein